MKTRFFPTVMLAALLACFSCNNAPKSDEAKTTEAKEVTEDKTGETWKLNVSEAGLNG